jgi:hypothetical protein
MLGALMSLFRWWRVRRELRKYRVVISIHEYLLRGCPPGWKMLSHSAGYGQR